MHNKTCECDHLLKMATFWWSLQNNIFFAMGIFLRKVATYFLWSLATLVRYQDKKSSWGNDQRDYIWDYLEACFKKWIHSNINEFTDWQWTCYCDYRIWLFGRCFWKSPKELNKKKHKSSEDKEDTCHNEEEKPLPLYHKEIYEILEKIASYYATISCSEIFIPTYRIKKIVDDEIFRNNNLKQSRIDEFLTKNLICLLLIFT